MKKTLLVICLSILLLLFFLVILPSFTIRKRQGTSLGNGNLQMSFIKNKPINFSFISDKSNLQSLSIDMKNPAILNNSKINFKISGPNSQREIVFYGNNIGDPSSVPLKFDSFSDPASTTYQVSLSTDNVDPQSLYFITNQDYQPLFNSYYLQSDLKTNLKTNFNRQLNLFHQRNLILNVIYITLIVYLILAL